MSPGREKFSTQVDVETLKDVREIARIEGRKLQSLVDEALSDVVAKHKHARRGIQPHAIAAYRSSHGPLGALYRKLAE
jgi:hypothetical protein